jgi:ABC-type ATPase with predicted acetyltransferase domain
MSLIPKVRQYKCPACGFTTQDELQPECPADGTLMEVAPEAAR